ncbi:histidine phosphatase superfamily [Hypoxylon sp. FL1857]|nr:histidine phosphatase superfamily [Hypoxylon sp. FL1857]
MAPIIHVMRHAQAEHNAGKKCADVKDPTLTEDGLGQCFNLQSTFPFAPDMIVASPMRRTIQTAELAFESFVTGGRRIILIPDLQEVGDVLCCIGSPRKEIEEKFKTVVRTAFMADEWQKEESGNSYNPQHLQERARTARTILRIFASAYIELTPGEVDPQIVVISHGDFIPYLVEDYTGCAATFNFVKKPWNNAEYRSYEFVDFPVPEEGGKYSMEAMTPKDNGAHLRETDDSLKRRNAMRIDAAQQGLYFRWLCSDYERKH